jgi:hypothetical protein
MDEYLVLAIMICICGVSFVIGLIVYAIKSKKGPVSAFSNVSVGEGTPLALPSPSSKKGSAPWYIQSWSNPKSVSSGTDGLKVSYKTGAVGMSSGTGFKANPSKSLPAESASVSYSIYFPDSFDFRRGGKAGCGMCLGTKLYECDTGGEHSNSGGSVRVTWKENGQGVAYMYLPTQAPLSSQSAAFKAVADDPDKSGIHIFAKSSLKFIKGGWNSVTLTVKLNSVSSSNGLLRLTINGVTEELSDVLYRRDATVKINTMVFATFFGGSSKDYAPLKSETATFKDFKFTAS